MKEPITTRRIHLSRFRQEQVDFLFQLNGGPEEMKYITLGKQLTFEEVKSKSIPRIMQSYNYGEEFGIFSAYLNHTEHYIGWFQFEPDQEMNDAIEIGWRLKREFWGHGYATEAGRQVAHHVFFDLGIPDLTALIHPLNAASARVAEKVGLSLTGTVDAFGTALDHYFVSRANYIGSGSGDGMLAVPDLSGVALKDR